MNVSGILVQSRKGECARAAAVLDAIDGVDVHQQYADQDRLIATIEADSTGEEVAILRHIKSLPEVIIAEMAYHRFEHEPQILHEVPEELRESGPEASSQPAPGQQAANE